MALYISTKMCSYCPYYQCVFLYKMVHATDLSQDEKQRVGWSTQRQPFPMETSDFVSNLIRQFRFMLLVCPGVYSSNNYNYSQTHVTFFFEN